MLVGLQAVVQEALDHCVGGRTVLVIAHRLSTVVNADRIIVIAHGQVQEEGRHEELLSRGGLYAQLVRRQLTRGIASLTEGVGGSMNLESLGDSSMGQDVQDRAVGDLDKACGGVSGGACS